MKNKGKVLFVSKLLFFTENNELIEQNLRISELFIEENIEVIILTRKSNHSILQEQLIGQNKEKISFISRDSRLFEIIKNSKEEYIMGIVGIVDYDAIFSFQNQIPLFNPEKLSSESITISEKVERYGLPISSFQDVIDSYKVVDIISDSYFRIEFSNNFSVVSLHNANTHYRPAVEVLIKELFQTNLKNTDSSWNQKLLLLILFSLMNFIITDEYFSKVDYWGTFPSSDPDNTDTAVAFLKDSIRAIGSGKPRNGFELLIRHTPMRPKRTSGANRLLNKADSDFDTLIINPDLKDKIEGKVICIIDDYITNGYSAEATKHLLFSAGAKEVIFISIGKFGSKYYSTNYKINGDVSGEFTYEFIAERNYDGSEFYNYSNDEEILGFKDLI